jgi:hypothetical protein
LFILNYKAIEEKESYSLSHIEFAKRKARRLAQQRLTPNRLAPYYEKNSKMLKDLLEKENQFHSQIGEHWIPEPAYFQTSKL